MCTPFSPVPALAQCSRLTENFQETHTEPKIKAENGVMYLPKLETHKVMDIARWQGARYHSMKGQALSAWKSGGLIE